MNPSELLRKSWKRHGLGKIRWTSLSAFPGLQVIMELRRIHQTIFEKGPRTSLQGKAHQAFQPVISWKAFQVARLQNRRKPWSWMLRNVTNKYKHK